MAVLFPNPCSEGGSHGSFNIFSEIWTYELTPASNANCSFMRLQRSLWLILSSDSYFGTATDKLEQDDAVDKGDTGQETRCWITLFEWRISEGAREARLPWSSMLFSISLGRGRNRWITGIRRFISYTLTFSIRVFQYDRVFALEHAVAHAVAVPFAVLVSRKGETRPFLTTKLVINEEKDSIVFFVSNESALGFLPGSISCNDNDTCDIIFIQILRLPTILSGKPVRSSVALRTFLEHQKYT